jgi:hypothetical protein
MKNILIILSFFAVNLASGQGNSNLKIRGTINVKSSNAPAPTVTTPAAPTLTADDAGNTLSASHTLGVTEILVSENGGAFVQYTTTINVGDVARTAGYWQFKVKAGTNRNESAVIGSPAFTVTIPNTNPAAPTIISDDNANTIDATHTLGDSEILLSVNNGPFNQFNGNVISFGNVSLPGGYYKFKIKSAPGRNESPVASSPAFSETVVTPPTNTVFTYTVPSTAPTSRTSAGIYKSDGTLVRTLWSGRTEYAGTYPITWDGTDDRLQPLPVDNYTFKLLSNNVNYDWEGVVGNTSTPLRQERQKIHTSFEPFNKMAISGGKAYYSVGYNEGNAPVAAFDLNNIQVRLDPYQGFGGWVMSDEIATDGTNIYIASYDNYNPLNSFIYARKISDNSIVNFSAGTTYQGTNVFFTNVIDKRSSSYIPTGLAVSSAYIFVAYRAGNLVATLNKTTGAVVSTMSVGGPTSLAVDGTGLWVAINSNQVQKFTINANGSLGTVTSSVSGLSDVVDIDVNGSTLAVADGGTSQQVKAFNTTTGASIWTLGQPGGIKTSPVVTDDRFAFWHIQGDGMKYNRGGVSFAPDGSFWVIDPSNNRMQHYDANRNFIERIMYLQHTRSCVVVGNNNKRILANGFEFEIDYTKPIEQGWKLKYNWEGNLNGNFVTEEWIKSVNTLSNGRTYGLVYKKTGYPSGGGGGLQIVELNTSTGLRFTNAWVNNNLGGAQKMYPDGSIYGIGGNGIGETEEWNKMTLTGFDTNNDPIYTTGKLPVTLPMVIGEPRLGGPRPFPYERTSSNLLLIFNSGWNTVEDGAYHLGGMDAATGKMMFKTSMGTFRNYAGDFPQGGDYDEGNGVEYAGTVALGLDRNIIWGYNGEGWKQGQTNKFNHYYDNGLFLGQFGVVGDQFVQDPITYPMMAGNAYMPQLTKEGSTYYLYHNDESVRGALSRWKITNTTSIQEQSVSIPTTFVRGPENPLPVGVTDLMAGLPYRAFLSNNTAGWTMTPLQDPTRWEAKTTVLTYGRRKSPDLHLDYKSLLNSNVTRTLGTNTNLSSWEVTGRIAYNGTNPNYWDLSSTSVYLDILDNTGKIITRIYQISDVPHQNTLFTVNNTTMFSKETSAMQNFTRPFRDIKILKSVSGIQVNYDTYFTSVTTPFEAGANMSNPSSMRLFFRNGNNTGGNTSGDGKLVTIDKFKFNLYPQLQ